MGKVCLSFDELERSFMKRVAPSALKLQCARLHISHCSVCCTLQTAPAMELSLLRAQRAQLCYRCKILMHVWESGCKNKILHQLTSCYHSYRFLWDRDSAACCPCSNAYDRNRECRMFACFAVPVQQYSSVYWNAAQSLLRNFSHFTNG